ncbi:MAG: 4-phosphoerythronate dehydrogenase PdxB [Hahellaceae bacterium]|nr:4-phosphoerythronate dehydrogenase PdxB [Hahellaceae bacterium]
MKIIADENIPLLDKLFGVIGEVVRFPGREIDANCLGDAEILLVRSVTKVNQQLLEGSHIRFVGTCTIGTDHIDEAYLQSRGIAFASAPACNANSVVEYVLSCLCLISESGGRPLEKLTVGIVGAGNVGGRLAERLQRMGIRCLINDPPRADAGATGMVSLDEIMSADVISLHTPLTFDGDHPTYHLFDAARIESLKSGQVLINTGRGAVVDNAALLQKLNSDPFSCAILDVWEGEPEISIELAKKVMIATPHIAGYSLEGKANGSEQIYQALCQHVGLPGRYGAAQFLPEPFLTKMTFSSQASPEKALFSAIRAVYDVRSDHLKTLNALTCAPVNVSEQFDYLRKDYPVRREFSSLKVQLKSCDGDVLRRLKSAGFNIKQ